MIHAILKDRPTKLLLGFTAFFCCNALIADAIGTKLFSLEKLLGLHPANWTLVWAERFGLYIDLRGTVMAAGVRDHRYHQ